MTLRLASPGATGRATRLGGRVRLRVRITCAALFLAAAWSPAERLNFAQEAPTDSQVEAAYLFNFLKFVEWPVDPAKDAQPPWVIGVVGNTSVSDDLLQLVNGKSVRGRELEVKKLAASADLRGCNILFIGASEKKRLSWILSSVHGTSVLTVADMDHFVESGGMIQFVIQDSRVRVAIDVGAANRAQLKVSSKLLSLAVAVSDTKGGSKD